MHTEITCLQVCSLVHVVKFIFLVRARDQRMLKKPTKKSVRYLHAAMCVREREKLCSQRVKVARKLGH